MMRRFYETSLLACSLALSTGTASAEPASSVSSEADRRALSVTVYNQDFGLVREVRELKLPAGIVALEFQDVAATIQPETVHIRSLAAPQGGAPTLSVLEQNYRFDLLTPQTLMEKYVGQPVRIHRYHPSTGKEDVHTAKLLSFVDQRPVIELNGEVTFDVGGRFAFPSVPGNLIARPTLTWLVKSGAPNQRVEVSYLARGLNWNADYVLVLNEDEKRADLNGWVTLVNQAGSAFKDAELKLVAGDVQRVETEEAAQAMSMKSAMPAMADTAFREEGLFEYHLYTLDRKTTLLSNEQKQVGLLEAKNFSVTKKLIFRGESYWFQSEVGQVAEKQKVGVFLDFQNTQKNGLGAPLPRGTLRVYRADRSGAQQFVGEDLIDHTPRDEKVRVRVGQAFDVLGDRKQLSFRTLGNCSSESQWEVELRNHKDAPVEVEVLEPVGGDWTIVSSNHPWERRDARTFALIAKVPSRGATKLTYTVRVRWC